MCSNPGQPIGRRALEHGVHSGLCVSMVRKNIVAFVFTAVLAKHTKSFNLVDILSVGVDRIQRNFEPMQRQVERWRQAQITDER